MWRVQVPNLHMVQGSTVIYLMHSDVALVTCSLTLWDIIFTQNNTLREFKFWEFWAQHWDMQNKKHACGLEKAVYAGDT